MSIEANRNVTVNGTDISTTAISTIVELRDSGIPICTLVANNENGKSYLATLHIGDEIVVKMIRDTTPPDAINWNTDPNVYITFRGDIQELSPHLGADSETCSVTAYGVGYHLKEMKVSKEVGLITPIPEWGYVFSDDLTINDSAAWERVWNAPYLNTYGIFGLIRQQHVQLNKWIGSYKFAVTPMYDGGKFTKLELHIVAGRYNNLGHVSSTFTVMPKWSIDGGSTWHYFARGGFAVTGLLPATTPANYPMFYPYLPAGTNTGGTLFTNYDPAINAYPPVPVGTGGDIGINIIAEFPYWDSRLEVKLAVTGWSGTSLEGGIAITEMFLEYEFEGEQGKSVRQLIAGDAATKGIIPYYVNSILGNLTRLSGYDVLTTDYIDEDLTYLISYMKFPYEDAFMCIQDIVKYGSALRFIAGEAGYHWKIKHDGKFMLAPVDNHDVHSVNGGEYITNEWNLFPVPTPLVVREDMISQQFKTEKPIANYVLVAGRYQYPKNDNICRGEGFANWWFAGGIGQSGTRRVALVNDMGASTRVIEFNPQWANATTTNNVFGFPFPDDFNVETLMGRNCVPMASFYFKWGGGTSGYELRCYIADPNNPTLPLLSDYFKCPIEGVGSQDQWKFVEVDFPNSKFMKDYGNWTIEADRTDFFDVNTAKFLDWSRFKEIKYWAIRFGGGPDIIGTPYCRMRGWSVTGSIIRAAYDSTSIYGSVPRNLPAYGCRMLSVKDTMSNTDSLSSDDESSPLALETIYDLFRYRPVRTTGEIQIPLDPIWEEGCYVWIQAEEIYVNDVPTNPKTYKINRWYRIVKVTHSFMGTASGASTKLAVTDDITSCLPVDTTDVYSVFIREMNPDFQTKTLGSLKSSADLDLGLDPIEKDYPS